MSFFACMDISRAMSNCSSVDTARMCLRCMPKTVMASLNCPLKAPSASAVISCGMPNGESQAEVKARSTN
eukprot:521956-Amphidinium_carterae.2